MIGNEQSISLEFSYFIVLSFVNMEKYKYCITPTLLAWSTQLHCV